MRIVYLDWDKRVARALRSLDDIVVSGASEVQNYSSTIKVRCKLGHVRSASALRLNSGAQVTPAILEFYVD